MFYKTGVDITNAKQMWNFLHDHYQYYTMSSWNGCKSIANNVKVYNLKLDGDYCTALSFLHDECDVGCLQVMIKEMCEDFEAENPGYEVYFNGRSGGYLVLSEKGCVRSILPSIVADYDTYEDFKTDCRGYGECVKDYIYKLREITKLVQDFDKLCDNLRDLVNEYSKKSYKDIVLADMIERFNDAYYDDLEYLGFSELTVYDDGSVDVSEIAQLECLKEALLRLFSNNGNIVEIKNGWLRIKEN